MKIRGTGVFIGFLCLFFLFFISAREERIYSSWRNANEVIFNRYFGVKRYLRRNSPLNSKVLTDMTELRKIENPFGYSFWGKLRKKCYKLRQNALIRYGHWLEYDDGLLRLERLNRKRNYFPIPAEDFKEGEVFLHRPGRLKEAMEKNDIRYFMCYFTGWWQTKKHFEEGGLKLIYNDEHFMIFELPDETNQKN